MTHRIQRLKAALFQNHREISLERALLYTASHQQSVIGSRRVRRTVLISAKRISASIVRFYSRTGKNGR